LKVAMLLKFIHYYHTPNSLEFNFLIEILGDTRECQE